MEVILEGDSCSSMLLHLSLYLSLSVKFIQSVTEYIGVCVRNLCVKRLQCSAHNKSHTRLTHKQSPSFSALFDAVGTSTQLLICYVRLLNSEHQNHNVYGFLNTTHVHVYKTHTKKHIICGE